MWEQHGCLHASLLLVMSDVYFPPPCSSVLWIYQGILSLIGVWFMIPTSDFVRLLIEDMLLPVE